MNPEESVEDFRRRILRLDTGMEGILSAAVEFPDSVGVRLSAAAFCLFGQTRDSDAEASRHLEAIQPVEPYDRLMHEALSAWNRHDFLRAAELFESLTARWPRDLFSAKCAEFLYYVLGQQHMGARFRSHMDRLETVHANDPDYLGMRAFAHELCGDFSVARAFAERAIDIQERNPWAQHALTHVLIREGLVDEGRKTMEKFLPQLKTCARLIYCHDAWHLALLCLEELDFEGTDRVLREHVWNQSPELVGEQIDAIALGWRMEMAGCSLDDFWQELVPHIIPRAGECFMPFLNAHYAYALSRADEEDALDEALAAVDARADEDDAEARRVWSRTGRDLVHASAAFGRGDAGASAAFLEPIMPDMTSVGGSDAQDDLFRQAYFISLARSGRRADARQYFQRFSGGKNPSALDRHFLAYA